MSLVFEQPRLLHSLPDLRIGQPILHRAGDEVRKLAWGALGTFARPPQGDHWIRFVFYHWVLDDQQRAFRQQLEFFRNHGDFLGLEDAIGVLHSGSQAHGKYFCITFDDGFKNCHTNAAPVLKEAAVPAAFFIPTKYIGLDLHQHGAEIAPFYERSWSKYAGRFEFLSWNECRELAAAGFTIGSHTHSHVRLADVSRAQAEDELRQSKAQIEAQLALPCRHFCCPWGKPHRDFDPRIHPEMARRIGYVSFLTTENDINSPHPSPFNVPRTGCDPEFTPAVLRYSLRPPFLSARKRLSSKAAQGRIKAQPGPSIRTVESEPVQVGKFPFPFKAAFTVSSDVDGSSPTRFRAVHALFCGKGVIKPNTPDWRAVGLEESSRFFEQSRGGVAGLGLEFADSFFLIADQKAFGMYRHSPADDRLEEDQVEGTNCRELICEDIRSGRIDTFHAFLHYPRRLVAPKLNEFYAWCERAGVPKPKVWTNHSFAVTPTGLCPNELQPNRPVRLARLAARGVVGPLVGRARFPLRYAFARYQGDWPESAYYVNDLLAANGLRYVWLNMDDLERNQIALPEGNHNGRPTILTPITMSDGVRYHRFHRCYGKPRERTGGESYLRDSNEGFDSSSLITATNLAALCASEGTCILYTHWSHTRSVPIADQTLARFALVRDWRDAGKIWVTTASRLLDWTRLRTYLRVVTQRNGNDLVVDIEGVDDPVLGLERVILSDLSGLVLTVPEACRNVTIALNRKVVPPHQLQRQGKSFWFGSTGGAVS